MSPAPSATVMLDIAEAMQIPDEGTLSQVLYRDDTIRVVGFAFDAGQELTDHAAAKPAIAQVVTGRIRLDLAGDPVDLGPGSWVRMDAGLTHAVLALEPSVMLLTLVSEPAAS